ncbi:MAG: glycosyltransferase [Actinomycetota bacterium]|nr:glycosyltransferase [Actinomycetota bacterium]
MSGSLRQLAVVIPARNEEQLLPRCLASVREAIAALACRRPDLLAGITVVLDRTADGSAHIVRQSPGTVGLRCRVGNVGRARDLGVRRALRQAGLPGSAVWIANTDADSTVPRDWLCTHAEIADAGWDVLVGTVQPERSDLSQAALTAWLAAHQLGEGHPHIHGANLGFRADVYTRLGGFRPHQVDEDRDFVRSAAAAGFRLLTTDQCRVTTSGRVQSRVRGGFADYLSAGRAGNAS